MIKIKDYLELVRIPNVFTAIADCFAGYFIVASNVDSGILRPLAISSACLYAGGIVFNDYFDFETDKKERPNRPLPSGRISKKTALRFGITLFSLGILFAFSINPYDTKTVPLSISCLIIISALLYDYLKLFFLMGACRIFNVLLGMSAVNQPINITHLLLPIFLGVYVTIIALLSKNKEGAYIKNMVLSIIVIDSLFVCFYGKILLGSLLFLLLIPSIILSKYFEVT